MSNLKTWRNHICNGAIHSTLYLMKVPCGKAQKDRDENHQVGFFAGKRRGSCLLCPFRCVRGKERTAGQQVRHNIWIDSRTPERKRILEIILTTSPEPERTTTALQQPGNSIVSTSILQNLQGWRMTRLCRTVPTTTLQLSADYWQQWMERNIKTSLIFGMSSCNFSVVCTTNFTTREPFQQVSTR